MYINFMNDNESETREIKFKPGKKMNHNTYQAEEVY